MQVRFFGVRGSTPAPGAQFVRVGGNTSCVTVSRDGDLPTIVLDGGTGLRRFSAWLQGRPFRGAILLGHLHWDHVQGLPFFAASEHPDSRTDVYVPAQGDAREVLARSMSPPHFPLAPDELRGRWRFHALDAGAREIEGFRVLALDIPHPGGRTFGFRVDDGSVAVAYLSDHGPIESGPGADGLGEIHDTARTLADGVDLLIHDAQHTAQEYATKAFLGHATPDYAIGLAAAAGARRLVLFHHDPDRTDDEVGHIAAQARRAPLPVDVAVEGLVVELGPG